MFRAKLTVLQAQISVVKTTAFLIERLFNAFCTSVAHKAIAIAFNFFIPQAKDKPVIIPKLISVKFIKISGKYADIQLSRSILRHISKRRKIILLTVRQEIINVCFDKPGLFINRTTHVYRAKLPDPIFIVCKIVIRNIE